MLKWLRGDSAAATDAPAGTLGWPQIAAADTAVVFKHSTSCPVSWMADRRMQAFRAANPDVPFFKVLVREQRDLSRQIESETGVRHESPQLLVLRRGQPIADTSHEGVTEEFLAEHLNNEPRQN